MTFKPGKYKTRDGRDAVVLCDDAPGIAPLVGYVVQPDGEDCSSRNWTRSGRISYREQGLDLMPPEPEQVVTWCVLWKDGSFGLKESPYETGINMADACVRVVLKPGQFDDETDPYTKGWNDAIEAASNEMVKIGATDGGRIIAPIRALKKSAP